MHTSDHLSYVFSRGSRWGRGGLGRGRAVNSPGPLGPFPRSSLPLYVFFYRFFSLTDDAMRGFSSGVSSRIDPGRS